MLEYFATHQCWGYRIEKCKLFEGCNVREYSKEKNVDFCFECSEFPCDATGFDSHLQKHSVDINRKMKDIGVENYYMEIKDKPRYE